MKNQAMRLTVACAVLMLLAASALAQEKQYEALEGVSSTATVYDFRIGDPEVAQAHLDLIHSMMNDPGMRKEGRRPEIVVVFIGPSANLISSEGGAEASGSGTPIAGKISEMDADGVKFEICMTTAHALEISADSILPEIHQVENGWISLVGYQHQGYAMIADF